MKKPIVYHDAFAGFITKGKKAIKPSEYVNMFAGFITKGKKVKPEYTKMFAGFIGRKKKKKITEGLLSKLFGKKPPKISAKDKFDNNQTIAGSKKSEWGGFRDHETLSNSHKYSDEHQTAIKHYTGDDGYHTINKHLYSGGKHEDMPAHHRQISDRLKSAIKSNKTPNDLVVHTGISRSPERANNPDHEHHKIELPAFTSTSLNLSTARQFSKGDSRSEHVYDRGNMPTPIKMKPEDYRGHGHAGMGKPGAEPANPLHKRYGHILSIHVPKGSHGAYVGHLSEYSGENEMILHPGAKLHVEKTPEVNHAYKTVHWKAHLVHDGVKKT